jgi:peptidoglycan/xylan/chitin deacetylase (PgdA/CDA1 family)
VTPEQAMGGLAGGRLPKFPVLVTIDDAHVDFLKVRDIFESFKVPALLFVCVGWSDIAGPPQPRSLLARIVALLQWGSSADLDISIGRRHDPIRLGRQFRTERAAAIDRMIAAREELQPEFGDFALQLEQATFADKPKNSCNWDELVDLFNSGIVIGCHSVSHVSLAKASRPRMAFEIREARDILCAKFGHCRYFAYPFGTNGSYNSATTAEIAESGFECAFLTNADFATERTDRYQLPRFVIPDDVTSLAEFRAIALGGAIPLDKVKRLVGIGQ